MLKFQKILKNFNNLAYFFFTFFCVYDKKLLHSKHN